MATILCVDDEAAVRVVLEHALTKIEHHPVLVGSVDEALKAVTRVPIDLVISDYRLPDQTGLDLIELLAKEGYRMPVIIMTGYSSIEHAVISIRTGAIDYLTKPIRAESLEIAVNQALEFARLRRENDEFRQEIKNLRGSSSIVGESASLRQVMDTIATVAPTRATVLLQGESGTGKELFARAIHDQSPRSEQPFVTINCAAMPEGLVESALFGHERGAFTGATQRSQGAFERANGGTLMLDEISEMRLDLQAKLLRVIQEQEFERVGGHQAIKVDVRLIATTNRDLKTEMDAGKFRSDLYYRLNVVPIHTPPLRERREDIARLAQYFVKRAAEQMGISPQPLPAETQQLLQQYDWPGNIRELANAVERAVILSRGGALAPHQFGIQISGSPAPSATPRSATVAPETPPAETFNLDQLARRTIDQALVSTGGNRTKAAKLLGISERTLRNKLNNPKPVPKA